VSRSKLSPLPYFETLTEKYRRDTEVIYFTKDELLAIDGGVTENFASLLSEIETPKGIPSNQLMNIADRSLKSKIKKHTGHTLKYTARDAQSKKLYAGMLGVTCFKDDRGDIFYHSGLGSGNIKAEVARNSPYRRITTIEGEVDLDTILPLLDEYFVKYGELTVLPYPVKYAREGFSLYKEITE
jgi:hypothetical protein